MGQKMSTIQGSQVTSLSSQWGILDKKKKNIKEGFKQNYEQIIMWCVETPTTDLNKCIHHDFTS